MIWTLVVGSLLALTAVALILVTFVQLLYLESQRLRTRETPALTFFKETLEDRLGYTTDRGAIGFSMVKHAGLALSGVLSLAFASGNAPPLESLAGGAILALLVMLIATYVVPQTLYQRTTGRWALPLVPVLRGLALLSSPIYGLLSFFHSLFQLGSEEEQGAANPDPSESIGALIDAGAEEGIIEEDDRRLIESVVAFGDKTVREVMTPRPNIVAIQQDRSLEELRQLVIHEQYSRIPVYEANIDQVVGFVHVRDMFELDASERQTRKVKELVRPLRIVPETKPVDDLLREMQQDGAHMAIVVDEYGNTAGLCTMEDLVEEILGEIRDEHEPERDVREEPDGSFVVSGSFDVSRLSELVDFEPGEDTESTTVGGLVSEWLGHVPAAGEEAERAGLHIEVLAANERRVEQVRLSRVPEPSDEQKRASA